MGQRILPEGVVKIPRINTFFSEKDILTLYIREKKGLALKLLL
jgi:hypothetical protein